MTMGTASGIFARPCRSCGTLVLDLRHEGTGRHAPIESEPVPDGNIAIDLEAGTYRLVGHDLRSRAKAQYVNHFARCPEPGRFRRGRPVGR